MKKDIQKYKMGTNWLKYFMTPKKVNAGWTSVEMEKDLVGVKTPDGKLFGIWNKKTGILASTANIKDVQW